MHSLPLEKLQIIQAKPVLKWAGGKSQLLTQINSHLPTKLKIGAIKRYIEPFVGGGAVYFDLIAKYNISEAILIDINSELIILYNVIKYDVCSLMDELEKIQNEYRKVASKEEYYYKIREEYNLFDKNINPQIKNKNFIRRAALTMFLNKTCFNGLYRVNKQNKFNVPIGSYTNPTIYEKDNLINASIALENATIIHGDFETAKEYITADSFIYYDPPYRPVSKTSAFISYTSHDFNDDAQRRLKEFFDLAHAEGSLQMLSNSDPKNYDPQDHFFDELYKEYNINRIYAKRCIRTTGKQDIRELLITNYSSQ